MGGEQESAEVGDLCALLPALPDDDQALPRHPRQARHLYPRAGGALCAQASFLGVDLAPLHSCHFLWSLRHQDDQLESYQTVPHRNSVVLLAADPGRDGRPLLRLLRVLTEGLSDNVWCGRVTPTPSSGTPSSSLPCRCTFTRSTSATA